MKQRVHGLVIINFRNIPRQNYLSFFGKFLLTSTNNRDNINIVVDSEGRKRRELVIDNIIFWKMSIKKRN